MNTDTFEQLKREPGIGRPKIVVIIGSTRFKDFHLGAAQRETLKGNVALIVGFFHHVDNVPISDETKRLIDQLGQFKIDMADEVFVVNVHGYIGKTTGELIDYARLREKPVIFMEPRLS